MGNVIRTSSKLSGWYNLKIFKPSGLLVRELSFPNLITNNGMNLWGTSDSIFSNVFVGSGNAEPAFTDTQLQALIATTSSLLGVSEGLHDVSPRFVYYRPTYQFGVGVAAGNISEIGVGAGANNLFSRALVLDPMGNPTTITVLPDEILQVEYEVRMYIPENDSTGTFTTTGSAGATYEYVSRPGFIGQTPGWSAKANPSATGAGGYQHRLFSGGIGDIYSSPSGTSRNASSSTALPYVSGSFERQFSATFGVSGGNGSNRSFAGKMGQTYYQFEFDPPLIKTNQQTLSLVFSHSWARV